jgi:hypothetical protein
MRKRFDEKLADALEITTDVLFRGYATLLPSQAGFIAELPGLGREPWKKSNWAEFELEKKLGIIAYLLGSDSSDVARLLDFGIALVEAKDSREGRKWTVEDGKLKYSDDH